MTHGRHAQPRTRPRHRAEPSRIDRPERPIVVRRTVAPGGTSRPSTRPHGRRTAVVSGLALTFAVGMAVASATSANASPLGSGEAAAAVTSAVATGSPATTTVAGQSFFVGDVAEQTVSWDTYSATSPVVIRAQVTSSEVAAAVAAARAQLATDASRAETPSEVAATTTLKRGDGAAMVAYALQYVGKVPYVMGGNTPATGFSCDTFVEYVYAAFGDVMTGDVDVIATHATVIPESEAKAGDLVYYPHHHIGIYDGAGGIIDAPKPGKSVSHRAVWGDPEYLRITG